MTPERSNFCLQFMATRICSLHLPMVIWCMIFALSLPRNVEPSKVSQPCRYVDYT